MEPVKDRKYLVLITDYKHDFYGKEVEVIWKVFFYKSIKTDRILYADQCKIKREIK